MCYEYECYAPARTERRPCRTLKIEAVHRCCCEKYERAHCDCRTGKNQCKEITEKDQATQQRGAFEIKTTATHLHNDVVVNAGRKQTSIGLKCFS